MLKASKKEYSKSCTRRSVYKNYFTIINGLLPLTKKEIDIVSLLYYYDNEISKDVDNAKLRGVLLFSKQYKSKITEELGIKALLLNNYIAALKNKGVIKVDENNASFKWLNPSFSFDIDADNVSIIFNLSISNTETTVSSNKEEEIVKGVVEKAEEGAPIPIDENNLKAGQYFQDEEPYEKKAE